MRRLWTVSVHLLEDGTVDLIWLERWHRGEVVRAWSMDWPNDANVVSAFVTAFKTLDFPLVLWEDG